MYASKWKNYDHIKILIDNNLNPDYLYIVDSYGGLFPNKTVEILNHLRKLKIKSKIGFHAHNNLELAFANTIVCIENNIDIVDSTFLGMGRGAGNLSTELLLSYKSINKNAIQSLNNLIDKFKILKENFKWGTNYEYMLSGFNSFPQSKVMSLLKMGAYNTNEIYNVILQNPFKKNFTLKNIDLNKKIKKVFILGNPNTVNKYKKEIFKISDDSKSLFIHSNFNSFEILKKNKSSHFIAISNQDLIKVSNIKRGNIKNYKIVTDIKNTNLDLNIDNTFTFEDILGLDNKFSSSLYISLNILKTLGLKKSYLIGYDGYENLENNSIREIYLKNEKLFSKYFNEFKLISLTPSVYTSIKKETIYNYI